MMLIETHALNEKKIKHFAEKMDPVTNVHLLCALLI